MPENIESHVALFPANFPSMFEIGYANPCPLWQRQSGSTDTAGAARAFRTDDIAIAAGETAWAARPGNTGYRLGIAGQGAKDFRTLDLSNGLPLLTIASSLLQTAPWRRSMTDQTHTFPGGIFPWNGRAMRNALSALALCCLAVLSWTGVARASLTVLFDTSKYSGDVWLQIQDPNAGTGNACRRVAASRSRHRAGSPGAGRAWRWMASCG